MKRLYSILIALSVIPILFIGNIYCSDLKPENSNINENDKKAIEQVLNSYLNCGRNLDFRCCSKILSKTYLTKFSKDNGSSYAEFYKATETRYHEAKITRIYIVDGTSIEAIVESYSEEPGVLSKDIENYKLENINGFWRIADFSIVTSTIVKEIGPDGKWKDVKHLK